MFNSIQEGRTVHIDTYQEVHPTGDAMRIGRSSMTVNNIKLEDGGYYKCVVQDIHSSKHNTKSFLIHVLGENNN